MGDAMRSEYAIRHSSSYIPIPSMGGGTMDHTKCKKSTMDSTNLFPNNKNRNMENTMGRNTMGR